MTDDVEYPNKSQSFILEVLNEASVQLLEIKEEKEIYNVLISAIGKLIPGAYLAFSKLQEDDMNFRIVQTHGLDKFVAAIQTLIGRSPYEIDFPFKDLAAQHREGFLSRKLYRIEDGLYGLSVGAIPKIVCKSIEKLIGVSNNYAISFFLENNFFGGLSIFVPNRILKAGIFSQEIILAIETLANNTSVLIQRFRSNHTLQASQQTLIYQNDVGKFTIFCRSHSKDRYLYRPF